MCFDTYRFHYGWKTPLRAEQPFTVQASLFVDASVQNVHSDHTWVHGVGVLLHSSLGHRLPRMAVEAKPKKQIIVTLKTLMCIISFKRLCIQCCMFCGWSVTRGHIMKYCTKVQL